MSDTCILCVEPDDSTRAELVDELQTHLTDLDPDYEARESIAGAETVLDSRAVDCIVTEYDLPDGTGLELVDRARTHSPDAGAILFTAAGYDAIDTTGYEATITEYLAKDVPRAVTRLADVVRTTVTRRTQTSYPLPTDEFDRVAALGSYALDSAGLHDSMERVTSLAARHFDVQGAEVNVIDERHQKTLAAPGAASPGELTERAASICTFTILEDDGLLAVEDVYDDPRFEPRGQEFETRGVRSYLGATLTSSAGFVIGTVCIYDEDPRPFSGADEAFLRDLAVVTMDLIEVHSRLARWAGPPSGDGPGDTEGAK